MAADLRRVLDEGLEVAASIIATVTVDAANAAAPSSNAVPGAAIVVDDSPTSTISSSSSSSSEEDDLEAVDLLQRSCRAVRLSNTRRHAAPGTSASPLANSIRVWHPGSQPQTICLPADCTVAQANLALAAAFPGFDLSGLVPAYPQLPGPFQCVVTHVSQFGGYTALVDHGTGTEPEAIHIFPSTNGARTSCPVITQATLLFGGKPWRCGPNTGFHGMRLTLGPHEGPCDSKARMIPTPCRNCCHARQNKTVGETTPSM